MYDSEEEQQESEEGGVEGHIASRSGCVVNDDPGHITDFDDNPGGLSGEDAAMESDEVSDAGTRRWRSTSIVSA